MSRPVVKPELTPQFCFSTTTLREFLRLSRSSVDDSINQHLNALPAPRRANFDPTTLSQRKVNPPNSNAHRIDPSSAQMFKDNVLFPAWEARSDVINYCSMVATSPDPSDPEAAIREMENEKDKERVVNERLDPYSGRFFPREARTEVLASILRQERGVEGIVRKETWDVMEKRAGNGWERWEDEIAAWRDKERSLRTRR